MKIAKHLSYNDTSIANTSGGRAQRRDAIPENGGLAAPKSPCKIRGCFCQNLLTFRQIPPIGKKRQVVPPILSLVETGPLIFPTLLW